jgi:hypothetical protein
LCSKWRIVYVEEVVGEVEALGSVGGGLFFIIGALLVPPKILMIGFNEKIELLAVTSNGCATFLDPEMCGKCCKL